MEAVPPPAESIGEPRSDVEADPVDHDSELVAWTLSLSPEERLDVLQDFVDAFWTPAHG